MTATIVRGDARRLPLLDASVDLIVTSPPYFGLRSYQDGGQHYGGQIGAEQTPAEYVAALLECTREWIRVLKPSGSLWVNLGDKYNSGSGAGPQSGLQGGDARTRGNGRGGPVIPKSDLPAKTLFGLPWRYALGCIDDLGLILRAEVIWSKPNGLPESVTDRVRRSHEQWFHLVKSPRYFAAVDEIREPHTWGRQINPTWDDTRNERALNTEGRTGKQEFRSMNPLGKLPGSVWEIATQPLRVPAGLEVDHFAAFPMEWPRRIISGWSPAGICTACDEGRRPIHEAVRVRGDELVTGSQYGARGKVQTATGRGHTERTIRTPRGHACACPTPAAPSRPAIVLDPFGGTGTTTLLATVLGRHGISVDMSADYCRLARWRTTDPGERARALGVPKPPPVMGGQVDLFAEEIA